MPRRLRDALFITVVALAAARVAQAQEQPEALIKQGVELRRHGQDTLAEGYFRRAYTLAHTPRSAAQLGLVEQALGSFLEAEQHLSEALDNADAWVEQNRSTLEQSRALVRVHLVRVETRGLPADTTVAVGHRAPVPVATGGVVWVLPGSTAVTFAAPDRRSATKELSGAAGATVAVDVELPAVAVPAAAAPAARAAAPRSADTAAPAAPNLLVARSEPGPGHDRRVAGVVVGSSGLALAVAGIITYLAGSSKLSAIKSDAAAGNPYNTANDDYRTLEGVGIGLAVAGAVAVAGGATLYFLNREPDGGAGAPALSVGYLPGTGGLLRLGGRF
jgi:hypothetical protein